MSTSSLIRVAARGSTTFFRANPIRSSQPLMARSAVLLPTIVAGVPAANNFSTSARMRSGDHAEETFEEFSARFEKEFDGVQDVFELQRNLNNAFAYDLVPSPTVVAAALKAARRVNDFATAIRIFEGIKAKVENKGQYEQYLEELKPLREELGVPLKEDIYPEEKN
ncbi:cytochrome c oxidase polypeptide vi [Colletotrichum truncatum]|uniref:Cytochrome c oxidase polypeptide vi n=1 Tax=Colletotrichum truncatum TaxID=5467 RepID=A0ACC3ZI50_COLTU|nr:cytochrome c oxidase polypeptide vi [Colletotrichum truncatum]KAF6785600.1 cytochrome c oxidase polypeptide vi [Colletotrichum truncatum]